MPAAQWHAWAESKAFSDGIAARLTRLALRPHTVAALLDVSRRGGDWLAYQETPWFTYAVLDAATRMVSALVEAGTVPRGCGAEWWLQAIVARVLYDRLPEAIPAPYWSVCPAPPSADGAPQVRVRADVSFQIESGGRIAA